jgi:hypothetical protein
VRIGPPKALLWPKPMSSINTITTFGAPSGAWTSNRGGAVASRASSVVIVGAVAPTIGSTLRSNPPAWTGAAGAGGSGLAWQPHAPAKASANNERASTLRM